MLVVALLGVAMIATWTWALWPQRKPVPPAAPAVVPLPRVESTEGLLVAQLFRGDITGPQYRRAMETLAVRDLDRHPITIPGDGV